MAESMAESEEYEVGYDFDLVEPLANDSLKCGICHYLTRKAQQTLCCGNCFCKKCLDKFLLSKVLDKKCPCCNVEDFTFTNDMRTQREVDDLKIFCPNKQPGGCPWSGELRSVGEHLEKKCQFTDMQCTNDGCQQMIRRELLEAHVKSECELRQVTCKWCNTAGIFQWITGDHQQTECVVNQLADARKRLEVAEQKSIATEQKYMELQKSVRANEIDIEIKKKLSAFHALEWPIQLNCLADEDSPGLPTVIKIPRFTYSNQDGWSSPSFTTHETGYKMFMKIYPNGYKYGVGFEKFISVALYLMKGKHDEQLTWPMKGTVNIQLLNILADRDHSQVVEFKFTGRDQMMCKVADGNQKADRASWAHEFFPLNNLSYNRHRKCQYLKDNCVYFRVQSYICEE